MEKQDVFCFIKLLICIVYLMASEEEEENKGSNELMNKHRKIHEMTRNENNPIKLHWNEMLHPIFCIYRPKPWAEDDLFFQDFDTTETNTRE